MKSPSSNNSKEILREALLWSILSISGCASQQNEQIKPNLDPYKPSNTPKSEYKEIVHNHQKNAHEMIEGIVNNPDGSISSTSCGEAKDELSAKMRSQMNAEMQIIELKCPLNEQGENVATIIGDTITSKASKTTDDNYKVCTQFTAFPKNIKCIDPAKVPSSEEIKEKWEQEKREYMQRWNNDNDK